MTLEAGKQLGPYQITGPAGAGGMGEVYKARDTRLDRDVAIKVLHTRVAENPDLKERFEREAKVIAGLNHPNICVLHDIGVEGDVDFLVMEYIEGETLSERLSKGPLPAELLLSTAIQIADALDKAHKQGLVHRDLKPGNVMLTKEGAKLLDFGLAKFTPESGFVDDLTSGQTRTTPLTTQGAIIGTLQYMAPEQLEGVEADARSDIFSFGAMLYEMAAGAPAFAGKSRASLIASVLKEEPTPVSQIQPLIPVSLELVIKQCMVKDPDQRWQSAGDLKRSLVLISEGGGPSNVLGVSAAGSKASLLPWIVAAVLLITTGLFGFVAFNGEEIPREVINSHIPAPDGTRFEGFAGGSLALSADGKKIAFNAFDTLDGKEHLWVRNLDSPTPLKLPGTEDSWMPFWSPDSRYIAFFVQGKLKKILATGGPALTLCDAPDGRSGSWNTDDVIIFTPDYRGPLFRVSAAGGETTQLTSLDSITADRTHRWPAFLPDGDHYLYYARTGSGSGGEKDAIRIGSLETGEQRHLIHTTSNAAFARGHIVYAREGTLMAHPFDPDKLELTGDAQPIAEDVSFIGTFSRSLFTLSPDGKMIFRTGEFRTGSRIIVFDSTGQALDTIGDWDEQYTTRLSPDGQFLATDIADQGGSNNVVDIWIHDIARGIKRRMTFDSLDCLTPAWAPDGESFAYVKQTDDSTLVLVKSASGMGESRRIFALEENMFINSWSVDGRFLFTIKQANNVEIWAIPLDTAQQAYRVIESAYNTAQATLSADGRWLAFTSEESGNSEVYVTPFPSLSGKWQVSINDGDRPHWTADGKRIFYLDDNDFINVAEVDGSGSTFRAGAVRKLFKVRGSRPGSVYDINADGTRFYVNQMPSGANESEPLVMIQNWDAALIQR